MRPEGAPADLEPLLDAAPTEPQRVHLRIPVDVRSASQALVALLLSIYMLNWAAVVFIPLMLGLMCSYMLSPAVDRLQRWHIPRALGAAMLLLAVVGGLGSLAYSISDDAVALVESLPDAAQKVRESLRVTRGAPEGAIQKVQRAAAKLEEAAD